MMNRFWRTTEPRLKVTLERHRTTGKSPRNYYSWSITFDSADPEAVRRMLDSTDTYLRNQYGAEEIVLSEEPE